MKRKSMAIFIALIAMPPVAQARERAEITQGAIEAHVRFLADDLLEGRNDGTPGHEIAARYVRAQFAAFGLKPGWKDSWFQDVPLTERQIIEGRAPSLAIDGRPPEKVGAIIALHVDPVISGQPIFLGYGLQNKALGIDETEGRELAGKIAVIFDGVPANVPQKFAKGKVERLAMLGVKAVLVLPTEASTSNEIAQLTGLKPLVAQLQAANVSLTPETAADLFEGSPRSFAQLRKRARMGEALNGFSLSSHVTLDTGVGDRTYKSPNVLGIIPGRDPALAHEVVVVTAHLDHIGRKAGLGGDNIFNGALDNASGVAMMVEIARAVMEGPRPRRTILFAAVTAEEDGLRGSDWLASNFPGGLSAIAGVVNLDMPILRYDFVDVTAFGGNESSIGTAVERAASRMKISVSPDPQPEENFFRRSDHYSFVQKGVPAVFLMTGFGNGGEQAVKTFLLTDYHHPSDDLDRPINWAAGAKFARLNKQIILDVANSRPRPRWYADSKIGGEFAPQARKIDRPR